MKSRKGFFGRAEEKKEQKSEKRPPSSPLVVLHGRRQVVLYDCKKILRYEHDEILLLCGKERLLLCGKNLFCASFSSGAVTVEGRLSSLSFLGAGEEADA